VVVHTSLAPNKIQETGTPIICSHKPQLVEISGTGITTELDIGGQIPIHPRDFAEMIYRMELSIKLEKENIELKKQLKKQPESASISLFANHKLFFESEEDGCQTK
jgi:hypothetical protein